MGGMMKLFLLLKKAVARKAFYASVSLVVLVFSFQNCSQTKFEKANLDKIAAQRAPISPVCSDESIPPSFENVSCLPPYQFNRRAIQNYFVICQSDGRWGRTPKGAVDYSQCNTCPANLRPADRENVMCPAPYVNDKKGIQNYAVVCGSNYEWTRTIAGPVDYSSCVMCDPAKRPSSTAPIACMAPLSSIISGIQNYTVTCNSSGQWQTSLGVADYKNCPDCNPATKPKDNMAMKCPNSADIKAVQNYSVMCVNHAWVQTATTFDTASCPINTCNPSLKPPTTQTVACSAPFESTIKAVRNFDVSCLGSDWFQQLKSTDESQCPKNCAGPAPANTYSQLNCPSPNQNSNLARQNYIYSCNNSTGIYDKVASGVVDYSLCPRSCTGTVPPNSVPISCDPGMTGTAYQLYSVFCDTATGQYSQAKTTVDKSMCTTSVCTGAKPPDVQVRACPAPFQDRMLAKQKYNITCDNINNIWRSDIANEAIDTSACPVNDCSGSPNPGSEQVVGSCPGGASGNVFKTCGVSCVGRDYTQVNCSQPNYSRCDCGANSTYNAITQQCVPNAASCTESSNMNAAVSCGAGYNGGTKFTTTTVSCPAGKYGAPSYATSEYNTSSCSACPAPESIIDTPICSANENAVPNSRTFQRTYSCASGAAVPSVAMTNPGTCNPKPVTCVAGETTGPAIDCGAGMTGTKTISQVTSCPNGPYGAPLVQPRENTGSCKAVPSCKGADEMYSLYKWSGEQCESKYEVDYCTYPEANGWPVWNGEVYYNSYEVTNWTDWFETDVSYKNGVRYRTYHRERCIIHIFQPGGGA